MKTDRKMSGFKRIASLFLALMIVLSLVPLQPLHVHAAATVELTSDAEGKNSASTFAVGQPIYITASSDTEGECIELYQINGSDYSDLIYWYYVNDPEGTGHANYGYGDLLTENGTTVNIFDTIPGSKESNGWHGYFLRPGTYELWLYKDAKTAVRFTITEATEQETYLEVESKTVTFGEPITITASCDSDYSWVEIVDAEGSRMDYYYVAGHVGVPMEFKLAEGEYKVNLYSDYNGENLVASVSNIVVEEGTEKTIETDNTTYAYATDMKINVSVASMYQSGGYWVGLYKEGEDPNATGTTSIFYSYTDDEPFNVAFVNPQREGEFKAGSYDVWLLKGEATPYTKVAKTTITVTTTLDPSKTETVNPTCTTHGTITYYNTDKTVHSIETHEDNADLVKLGHDYQTFTPGVNSGTEGVRGDTEKYYHTLSNCTRCTLNTETEACSGWTKVGEDGSKVTYQCEKCEGTVIEDTSKIEDHRETKEPTCTQQGYTEIFYKDGSSSKQDYVPALEHDFEGVAWVETGDGYHTHICQREDCDKGEGYVETEKCESESVEVDGDNNALKFVCDDCGYKWSEDLIIFLNGKTEYHVNELVMIKVNECYPHSQGVEWLGLYKGEDTPGTENVSSLWYQNVYDFGMTDTNHTHTPGFEFDISQKHEEGKSRPEKIAEVYKPEQEFLIYLSANQDFDEVASVRFTVVDCEYDQKVEEEKYLVPGSVATCKESASYYYSCVCGEKGTETFFSDVKNAENHANPASEWDVDDQIHQKVWTCCLTPDGEAAPHGGWENGKCGDCGYACTHKDTAPKDHICDICTTAGLGEHKQAAGKHTCGYCNAEMSKCSDGNKDHKCDICSAAMGEHKAAAGKHTCAYCSKAVTSCADANKDHKCDTCSAAMGEHKAAAGKHTCAYCSKAVTECADSNKDHKCDTCSAAMGEHKAAAGKHTCAYCSKAVTECADANKDYKCDVCGKELEKPEEPKDEEPKEEEPKEEEPKPEDPKEEEPEEKPEEPTVNQPVGVGRLAGNTRYDTAFQAADELKKVTGKTMFDAVIVSSGEQFADALAGSYLAAVKGAPILLMKDRNKEINAVKEYIKANVNPGGTVYLLGGVNAVPAKMETGLEGFNVKRLGGNDRYATNLQILEEAGVAGKDVVVCTGRDFADSLSASAVGLPILLVKDKLNDKQLQFMAGCTGKIYVIGGVNAVSARVESQLKSFGNVERLAGNTRYDTSALVAKTFFSNPTSLVLAYGKNFPDGLSGGPVAFAMGAPLILTEAGKEKVAAAYVAETGIQNGYVQGGTAVLPEKTVNKVFGK